MPRCLRSLGTALRSLGTALRSLGTALRALGTALRGLETHLNHIDALLDGFPLGTHVLGHIDVLARVDVDDLFGDWQVGARDRILHKLELLPRLVAVRGARGLVFRGGGEPLHTVIDIIQVGGDDDGVLLRSYPFDPSTQPAVVQTDLQKTDLRLEWKDAHARGRQRAARAHH